jgi:hypothetical protein
MSNCETGNNPFLDITEFNALHSLYGDTPLFNILGSDPDLLNVEDTLQRLAQKIANTEYAAALGLIPLEQAQTEIGQNYDQMRTIYNSPAGKRWTQVYIYSAQRVKNRQQTVAA